MISTHDIFEKLRKFGETHLSVSIERDDENCLDLMLKIRGYICRVSRHKSVPLTRLLVEVSLSEEEYSLISEISTQTWQYLVEMAIMRQNNAEVFMLTKGDFALIDYMFDGAFSIHLLNKRARAIVSDVERFRSDMQKVLDMERLRKFREELEEELRKTLEKRGPRPSPPEGMYI